MRLKGLILGLLITMVFPLMAEDTCFKMMVTNSYTSFSETDKIQTMQNFKYGSSKNYTTLKELYAQGWKVIQIERIAGKYKTQMIIYMDKKVH